MRYVGTVRCNAFIVLGEPVIRELARCWTLMLLPDIPVIKFFLYVVNSDFHFMLCNAVQSCCNLQNRQTACLIGHHALSKWVRLLRCIVY